MSDESVPPQLDAYAKHLQQTADLAPAAEIRRRAGRRRRYQAAAASFVAVLIAAAGLGLVLDRRPREPVVPAVPPSPTSTVRSDLTRLREIGVALETGVLIDVADDGVDRWMRAGPGDVVDFGGAARDDSTEMSLVPAPVAGDDQVWIVPVARPGWCVTDTPQPPRVLQPCREGAETQVWTVVPAGDSGQFQLQGRYGIITDDGRTGLQTIEF